MDGQVPPAAPPPSAAFVRPRRNANGEPDVKRVGVPRDGWRDIYHFVLVQPWWRFYALLISTYMLVNCIFATLYWLQPGAVGEAHPGAWDEDFFFSLETLATVGYGVMHPVTLYAHWLAAMEIMVGVLAIPLLTGITINKFARPVARVTFSRNVLVAKWEGTRTLLFRLANIRSNQIFDAHIVITLLKLEIDAEGRAFRRLIDVIPMRTTNPMFVLTWTVMHPIVPSSPLYGMDLATLRPGELEIMAVMTGLDATSSSIVHARHFYQLEDLRLDYLFEDIVQADATGRFTIDYSRLHDLRPVG